MTSDPLGDRAMTNIYAKRESIRNALLDVEEQTQLLLDKDNTARK